MRRSDRCRHFCAVRNNSRRSSIERDFGDIDEGHHALPDNQWGKCVNLFKNAYGLGVTATPLRADRKGLDGVYDSMVVGPTMRDLINQGHLSEYRIFCPQESFDLANVRTGSGGDYVKKELDDASDRSTIAGDVVQQYLKLAPGKRGLTFAVNLKAGAGNNRCLQCLGRSCRFRIRRYS